MNVYAFQTDITWEDKVANYENIHTLGERFKPQPGGLIVLPEMFATGFSMQTAVTKEPEDGPSFTFLSELAQRTQCHVWGAWPSTKGTPDPPMKHSRSIRAVSACTAMPNYTPSP